MLLHKEVYRKTRSPSPELAFGPGEPLQRKASQPLRPLRRALGWVGWGLPQR